MSSNEDFYETKFPFIEENLFLVAWVDKKTGKQKLKFQKINPESREIDYENSLDCIHTAVTTINYMDFAEIHETQDSAENFAKNMINARTTESLQTVNLSPEEHFFAFKSWTQGIAEAGLDALNLQTDIESATQFQYPIVDFLLKSLMKVNFDYIGLFLENIKKSCKYEGVYHKSSLRANFLLIFSIIQSYLENYSELYYSERNNIKNLLIELIELDPEFVLKETNFEIKKFIAENKEFTNLKAYSYLFYDKDIIIREILASNVNATRFEDYKRLFNDKELFNDKDSFNGGYNVLNINIKRLSLSIEEKLEIKEFIAKNSNAAEIEEYKQLYWDKNNCIEELIAGNPNATKFDEYRNLGSIQKNFH